jgi:hypothetical protein
MIVRGRGGGPIAVAAGVAAAMGAAQLGLGYGLDIISWTAAGGAVQAGQASQALGSSAILSSEAWIASLTWATWIAATSAIAGAITAHRLSTGGTQSPPAADDRTTSVLWRLVLATAAALGAGVAVALVAIPSRVAEVAETSTPQAVAAGYAVVGVIVGLAVAVGALTSRAVAANLIATGAWLWLLAIVAVVDGVLAGRDWSRVPLAFWEFTTADPWFRSIFLPDAGLALGAALVIGVLAALPAARRGDPPTGVVLSGAAGPLVLAAAYLLAQPDLVGADAVDLSRHLVTPYLLLAGLIGSLIVSTVRPRRTRVGQGEPATATVPARGTAQVPTSSTGTATQRTPRPRETTGDREAPDLASRTS